MAGIRIAPVLALALLLGACGGDGGIAAVSLSTPPKALQAVAPAMLTVEFDSGFRAPGGSAPSYQHGMPLRRAWLGAKSAMRAGRGGGKGGSGPRATTEPCEASGSTVYGDPVVKDVNSPFTNTAFDVYPSEDRDCRRVEESETGYTEYYSDGKFEFGYPTDDPGSYVYYEKNGSADARARFGFHDVDGPVEFEISSSSYGVFHSEHAADGTSSDEISYGSFRLDSTYTDHESGDGGTVKLSGYVGTSSNPFEKHTDGAGTALDGPFALSTGDYPECELGAATISTLAPMYLHSSTGNIVGTVEVAAGSHTAVVDMNADGSVDVALDGGAPQTLSAGQVEELRGVCPFFPLF
jgi:hypothetical protein